MGRPNWTDEIERPLARPNRIEEFDDNPNARGLENVARGAFSGAVNNLDARIHGSPATAVTVINLRTVDNEPRQFTVTLASPLAIGQVQYGNASALVEWGSGGFNSSFVCDAREGQQFCLTCASLRVSIFNDALAQGYDTNNIINDISNPITFGAFASLGNGVNHRVIRRSEIRLYSVEANGLVPGALTSPFIVPKHAADVKVYPFPANDFVLYQVNPYSVSDSAPILSTEVLAGDDCPTIALAGDTKQVQFRNSGTVNIGKLAVVWGLSV